MPSSVTFTGVTIYNPDKCWPGYTLIPSISSSAAQGARLIDMNGRVVNAWRGVLGAFDNKLLPGGDIIGSSGVNFGHRHDMKDLIQVNWENKIVWKYDRAVQLEVKGKKIWTARAHHDFQRRDNPVGYYAPGQLPLTNGTTLFNSTLNVDRPDIAPCTLADTRLMEIEWEGNLLWDWLLTDHWDELELSETAKNAVHRHPGVMEELGYAKEIYLNNCAYVGPNKWYDQRDERFHPENIITDIRALNISFIISKKTGGIVWKLGPDYYTCGSLRKIGTIIGQHQVHVIPRDLPGEGNILIFDNGGEAGYGNSTPSCPTGQYNALRYHSRVLEINPVTMEVEWSYGDSDKMVDRARSKFFSAICSGMQRLPNGNTLICETTSGRIFEVTRNKEIVWEYLDPGGFTFRAHRYPYEWVTHREKPDEREVIPPKNIHLRIENCALSSEEDDSFFTREERWR